MNAETSAKLADHPKSDFVAELTPYRSMGRNGFVLIMALIVASCVSSGVMFWKMGAWPVLFFLAADVLFIWLAFKLSYRSGKIKERIYVNRQELRVEKYSASGRCQSFLFNPFWTRFEIARHNEFGILSMDIISPEKSISVGSFLNPQDREDFSRAFSSALVRAKA